MMLADYLDIAGYAPWRWGSVDCVHFAGDWIRIATGADPLGPYRERYASAAQAALIVMRAGGLDPLVAAEMERCGFGPADDARSGDIAVLPVAGGAGVAGAAVAIADGPWWIARTREGIAGFRAAPRRVWRVLA